MSHKTPEEIAKQITHDMSAWTGSQDGYHSVLGCKIADAIRGDRKANEKTSDEIAEIIHETLLQIIPERLALRLSWPTEIEIHEMSIKAGYGYRDHEKHKVFEQACSLLKARVIGGDK